MSTKFRVPRWAPFVAKYVFFLFILSYSTQIQFCLFLYQHYQFTKFTKFSLACFSYFFSCMIIGGKYMRESFFIDKYVLLSCQTNENQGSEKLARLARVIFSASLDLRFLPKKKQHILNTI